VFINKGGYTVYGTARRIDKINDLKELEIKNLEIDVTHCKSMDLEILKNNLNIKTY